MPRGSAYQSEYYDEHYAAQRDDVREQRVHPLLRSFEDMFAERVLSLALGSRPTRTVRVYEPGCGEGLLADALQRVADRHGLTLEYTGSDVSAAALDLARESAVGRLEHGDAVDVTASLSDASFDVVIAKNLLHHLDDPTAFLVEAGRVAGPSGRIVVAEPRFGQPLVFFANLAFVRRERHYFKGPARNRAAVADAGLAITREEPFCWFPYELACATRLRSTRRLLARVRGGDTIARLAAFDQRWARRMPWWTEYYLWLVEPAVAGAGVNNV